MSYYFLEFGRLHPLLDLPAEALETASRVGVPVEVLELTDNAVRAHLNVLERDGLVTVEGDRHLELTEEGRRLATRVMRKHRLAERLLTDVIGLDWELVHE